MLGWLGGQRLANRWPQKILRDKSGNRFADLTGLAGLLDLTDGKPGGQQTTGRNGLWQARGAWPDKATGRIIYLVRTANRRSKTEK